MRRVLLTGAGGFIGSHCVAPLLERGFEVHAVSRSPRERDRVGAVWHCADLLEPGSARALVEGVRPTDLLHLAWYVVPGKLIAAPENYEWVRASFELVRSFAESGGHRLAVCGSGYEYDWAYGYCTEDLTPCVPDTVYGACKHALHELVRVFAGGSGLSAVWPRVFFLYGPRENPQRLVASVARALLCDQPAPCSHGRQIRDYLHVQDVADGLVAALASDLRGAVNICSGEATTLGDIVTTIGRITGRESLVRLGAIPARANDAPLVVGSNARAAALGWSPTYDLESGLRHTVTWWSEQVRSGAAS